jgi:hypothetical protein
MPKRNNPSTSTDAYKSLQPEKIAAMYVKIVEALTKIGPSTYEQLADYMGEKPERVWKRLSEAGRFNLIHRPGKRKTMRSGRQGFVWSVGPSTETIQREQKVMKGKTVADHSRAIKKLSQPILNQPERLF